jgi:hypothetical protein
VLPLKMKKFLALLDGVIFLTSFAYGAAITGTVKGPDGAPFRAAFVEARNARTRITVMVLSDKNGRYRVKNLPPGDYQAVARAIGYRSESHSGIFLTDTQDATIDWSLQKQTLRWTDIPVSLLSGCRISISM